MKKKLYVIMGLFSIFIVFLFVFLNTQLKVVSEVEEKSYVLKNKVWKIQFSKRIDPKSVNEDTVYVLNEKNEKVDISVILNEDRTALLILPPQEGYDVQEPNYTLYISKDIQSNFGRNLSVPEKISFVVKESLPSAESKSNLNAFLLKRLTSNHISYGLAESESKEESKADTANDSGHSETNVQVQGIDESDMVKTDSTHIYQVMDGKLQIVKAVPAEKMILESSITYNQSFYPYELFLHKNQLIVIGHSYKERNNSESKSMKDIRIAPIHETTKVIIYDVKNKTAPKQIREIEIEGSLASSRLMNGKVYLIVNKYPDIWLLKENPELDMRPKYFDSVNNEQMKAANYVDIQLFPDSNETNFTNIAVVDLENPSKEMALTTYLGSGNQLFMSKNNLYLAITNYVPKIKEGSEIYNPNTTIYKYSVEGMNVKFHSSSEVPGTVLNQFSMDENKGYFRVVTTSGQVWDDKRPSANNLYILNENLQKVGQLENLARGERIYSARFMNDRIYMVTFRETDPLFVIDSSNPEQPKVLGELKIPGFSNYLHPYDENHLIGFGHDTKVVAGKGAGNQPLILTNGVKISMFDVTDMANPKEKFTEIIGGRGTYSPLNYDHKALLFDKKKQLFAFPISVYENVKNNNENQFDSIFEFQGAYVYHIDIEKGFTLKAKITHQDHKSPYEEWENNINRIVYINDSLFTLSPMKFRSFDLNTFKPKGELILSK